MSQFSSIKNRLAPTLLAGLGLVFIGFLAVTPLVKWSLGSLLGRHICDEIICWRSDTAHFEPVVRHTSNGTMVEVTKDWYCERHMERSWADLLNIINKLSIFVVPWGIYYLVMGFLKIKQWHSDRQAQPYEPGPPS